MKEAGLELESQLTSSLRLSLSFSRLVWLFPAAYALHVLEEFPNFTNWAQRYASPSYTMREYVLVHSTGLVVAIISALILSINRHRYLIFIFFTFVFTPAAFCNIFFHVGATFVFRAYCPGVITAVLIYLPLFLALTRTAFREQLLTKRGAAISLVLATIIHAGDVSHNVFKVW